MLITYLNFLSIFIITPIIIQTFILFKYRNKLINYYGSLNKLILATLIISAIALFYTTPWDNYLVATGVWFYSSDLISGLIIFYVPIEEYLFFILESIFVAEFLFISSLKLPKNIRLENKLIGAIIVNKKKLLFLILISILWIISLILFISRSYEFLYLSLILIWAIPPLFLLVLLGSAHICRSIKMLSVTISCTTLYLSAIDFLAIYLGIWEISESSSTNILILNILPIEEALFFFITTILVSFGTLLILILLMINSKQKEGKLRES